MSIDILFYISNGYMLHRDISRLDVLMEKGRLAF